MSNDTSTDSDGEVKPPKPGSWSARIADLEAEAAELRERLNYAMICLEEAGLLI
jgi:hypothetical protein